jgi:hypothetical protein
MILKSLPDEKGLKTAADRLISAIACWGLERANYSTDYELTFSAKLCTLVAKLEASAQEELWHNFGLLFDPVRLQARYILSRHPISPLDVITPT